MQIIRHKQNQTICLFAGLISKIKGIMCFYAQLINIQKLII